MTKNKPVVEQGGESTEIATKEGRVAFDDGKGMDANPYTIATSPWSRRAWDEGYHSARRAEAFIQQEADLAAPESGDVQEGMIA